MFMISGQRENEGVNGGSHVLGESWVFPQLKGWRVRIGVGMVVATFIFLKNNWFFIDWREGGRLLC